MWLEMEKQNDVGKIHLITTVVTDEFKFQSKKKIMK